MLLYACVSLKALIYKFVIDCLGTKIKFGGSSSEACGNGC